MFALLLLASIAVPAAVLFGVYLMAKRLDHPAWAYASFAVDVAAAGAGLYILGLAPEVASMAESTRSVLFRYTLGAGLLLSGVRVGYESWRIRDS